MGVGGYAPVVAKGATEVAARREQHARLHGRGKSTKLIFCNPLNFIQEFFTLNGQWCSGEDGGAVEGFAHGEFGLFAVVPLVNGSQVTDDSAVDFAVCSADGALFVFATCVAVGWADAKGRGQGEVGQF